MTSEKNPNLNVLTVTFNNGFIFLLAPIDYRLPIKILHIEKHTCGNYNEHMNDISKTIINSLSKHACEHGLNVLMAIVSFLKNPSSFSINKLRVNLQTLKN